MTTNGTRLPQLAGALAGAGLQRVNIHLDSVSPDRLAPLMRWNTLDTIWAGIEAATRAGLTPIKINVVVTRGYNEPDVVELARLTLVHDWHIRFIELMPLGTPAEIAFHHYVPTAESFAQIEAEVGPLLALNNGDLDGEARTYRLPAALGTVGFISPISAPYCDRCSRLRLTADGRLRLCLLAEPELDLRDALRNGGSHQDLVALFRRAVQAKPAGSGLRYGLYPQNRTMSQIGG